MQLTLIITKKKKIYVCFNISGGLIDLLGKYENHDIVSLVRIYIEVLANYAFATWYVCL